MFRLTGPGWPGRDRKKPSIAGRLVCGLPPAPSQPPGNRGPSNWGFNSLVGSSVSVMPPYPNLIGTRNHIRVHRLDVFRFQQAGEAAIPLSARMPSSTMSLNAACVSPRHLTQVFHAADRQLAMALRAGLRVQLGPRRTTSSVARRGGRVGIGRERVQEEAAQNFPPSLNTSRRAAERPDSTECPHRRSTCAAPPAQPAFPAMYCSPPAMKVISPGDHALWWASPNCLPSAARKIAIV